MTSGTPGRLQGFLAALRTDWREIGGLGRLAMIGIVLAFALTVVLGFFITANARTHLLEARAEMIHAVVRELPPFPTDRPATPAEFEAFDTAVRTRLLGGETIRVKLWAPDGTIVYADARPLRGRTFPLSPSARIAFSGDVGAGIAGTSDAAHALTRESESLFEVYIPFTVQEGRVTSVIEVEQRLTALDAALVRITRSTWLAIGLGLAALGAFMTMLMAARARDLNQRRRQAEHLLRSSFSAREEERRRIVGALHDDIGQPLYRLLYGLGGARAKLTPDHPAARELERLEGVVREVDATLRRELRLLHEGLAADAGLETALTDLVAMTRRETDLDVSATVDLVEEPPAVYATALYRAAKEAVTNVRKHARARSVRILLRDRRDRLVLEVEDDGSGPVGEPGLGLTTTRERFEALGGSVQLVSRRQGGTLFRAWLPRSSDGAP